jgi:hypothetical protein
MISFNELKEVILQGEVEILQDNYWNKALEERLDSLYLDFQDIESVDDLVRYYNERGFDISEGYDLIIGTMMQLAAFKK